MLRRNAKKLLVELAYIYRNKPYVYDQDNILQDYESVISKGMPLTTTDVDSKYEWMMPHTYDDDAPRLDSFDDHNILFMLSGDPQEFLKISYFKYYEQLKDDGYIKQVSSTHVKKMFKTYTREVDVITSKGLALAQKPIVKQKEYLKSLYTYMRYQHRAELIGIVGAILVLSSGYFLGASSILTILLFIMIVIGAGATELIGVWTALKPCLRFKNSL